MRDDWSHEAVFITCGNGVTLIHGRTFLVRFELRSAGYTFSGDLRVWWSRTAGVDYTYQLVRRTGCRAIVHQGISVLQDSSDAPRPEIPDVTEPLQLLSHGPQQPRARKDIQNELAKLRSELDLLDQLEHIPKRKLRAQ